MLKKILSVSLFLVSCNASQTFDVKKVGIYDDSKINILKEGNNFKVNKSGNSSFQQKVDYVNNYLEELKSKNNGYENFKIASVSTGISNFLYQMGVKLRAVSNSQALNNEIKEKRMSFSKENFECKSKDDDYLIYREKGEKINNYTYPKTGCYKYEPNNNHKITFLPNIKPTLKKTSSLEDKNAFYNLGNPLKPSLEILKVSKSNVIFSNTSILAAIDHTKSTFYNSSLPTVFLPSKSFEDVFVILETVGKKLGLKEKVDKLWKQFYDYQNKINTLVKNANQKALKTLFLMQAGTTFYTYGKASSAYSISKQLNLEFLGKENKQSFYNFSKEKIIKMNPEVLVVSVHGYSPELAQKSKNEIKNLDWVKQIKAYQNDAIYVLGDYSLITHKTYDVVYSLAKQIYGKK